MKFATIFLSHVLLFLIIDTNDSSEIKCVKTDADRSTERVTYLKRKGT